MRQYILDTHALIWFVNGNKELSHTAQKSIEDENATNFVSIASLWEIAIKVSLGKLELKKPFYQIQFQILQNGFHILPVMFEDTLAVATLPLHHRDPFDRIIIAQAISNKMSIISKDPQLHFYDVKVVW